MIRIRTIIISLLIILTLSSCENWLDVNESPNTATKVDPQYLFGYAVTSWSGNRTGGDCYWPIGFMSQLISTGGSFGWGFGEDRYDISPYSTGNTWKMYYATSGANLKRAIELAEEQESPNIAAQSKIVLACMFYECTMIWGDVPYSEAWTDENYPKFDAQEDILNNLIALLDEAIQEIDETSEVKITTEDVYYNGDLSKWIKLATSMKLKIALTMVDADPEKANLIGQLISSANLITDSADDFKFPFGSTSGNENPKYKIFKNYNGGINNWMMANSIMLDSIMKPLDDPRIEKYFIPGDEADGEYIGVYTATNGGPTQSFMRVGDGTSIAAESPDVILSSSEINLFLAEIYLRGIGTAADKVKAETYFQKGLQESLMFYDVDEDAIATFIDRPELDLTSIAAPLRVLHEQQWIDLYNRAVEAWVQQRRSGSEGNEVPLLKTPNGAPAPTGKIARRWPYPDDELTGNINAPTELPKMWDNLWFDN